VAVDHEARRQKRLEMFRQVAAERIAKLNLLWIEVERSAGDPAAFLREAHTLKGEAGLTGFVGASKLVHAIEDCVKVIHARGTTPDEGDGDLILGGLDIILRLTHGAPESTSTEADDFLARVRVLLGGTAEPVRDVPPATVAGSLPVSPALTMSSTWQAVSDEGSAAKLTPAPVVARKESSIRIKVDKIDHLRSMVSDLLLSNVRWRQLTHAARRLRESAQEMQYGRSLAASEHDAAVWASILAGLSGIESHLREETHDLERLIGELDGTTRDLRMIPLGTLLERFPVPLRQLARSLGRQVRFETVGEQVEVDKALLEMLEEPLLHLLRNAVDHGIESPAERARAGKAPEATVRIVAGLVGQRLSLQVSDDGRGIDVEFVRRRGIATGLLDPASAATATEDEILRTIFSAGFSTREVASEVSGRGIGLNIVLDVAENVGGKIEVRTHLGRGTTFDIEVPLTVAITRVVLFRVGMAWYALPAASVRGLIEARTMDRGDGPEGPFVRYAGVNVPVLDLGGVLDEPEVLGAGARIIIAQSGADLVALTGSTGHLEREVMLKPLGRFFENQPLVPAAVSLEDGALALVLKTAELVLLARSRAKTNAPLASVEGSHGAGRIALVADDSPVVRDIIAQALRSYGLHVLVAGDGEEALALFGAHARVDIVVTDIDMPRLDGLGLVRALRQRERSRDVPVVAISMRGTEPEKRAAMEAGMSAYIDKSNFNQALLWQTIRPFVART
jgi:chemotaxis protein histidine kinase CheA